MHVPCHPPAGVTVGFYLEQVDSLVDHFTRFAHDERELPTVWHQALLTFVQRYKHEIRAEDKDALKRLMKTQYHYQVRIRRSFGCAHRSRTLVCSYEPCLSRWRVGVLRWMLPPDDAGAEHPHMASKTSISPYPKLLGSKATINYFPHPPSPLRSRRRSTGSWMLHAIEGRSQRTLPLP